jgi:PKD repeat protein
MGSVGRLLFTKKMVRGVGFFVPLESAKGDIPMGLKTDRAWILILTLALVLPQAGCSCPLTMPWSDGRAYRVRKDAELAGGEHTFSSVNIPADVTVTVTDDVVIHVTGDTNIAGTLTGDCVRIALQGQGDVTITGTVDNQCAEDAEDTADLVIQTDGGNLAIGALDAPAEIHTSGTLEFTNDPSIEEWEFDVLPDERSSTPLPPVCSAWADTLVGTALPDSPVEVAFYAAGADPDGGPVTYAWDFGDGASSAEREPLHAYSSWGVFDVGLTVTDDDDQTCRATLRVVLDDGEENVPEALGLWAEPLELVVEAGEEAFFAAGAQDPLGHDLTYEWDFGDSGTLTEPEPAHTYRDPGRYPVTLTVADPDGVTSTASASIYVYPSPPAESSSGQGVLAMLAQAAGDCDNPGRNVFAGNFTGRSVVGRGSGNLFIARPATITAKKGKDGKGRDGTASVGGNPGRPGGSVFIGVQGNLTVCGGATITSGTGGKGGNANATGNKPRARGGNGGRAGRVRLIATKNLLFMPTVGPPPDANIVMKLGNGGAGGIAEATGKEGTGNCNQGGDGRPARAYGGNGGPGIQQVWRRGNVSFGPGVTLAVSGGQGGTGGWAQADGGWGGSVLCPAHAVGGKGGKAEAQGGRGGNARVRFVGGILPFLVLDPGAFKGGDGGRAGAVGGLGGAAEADNPGPCGNADAEGGDGAKAVARGGKGGKGRTNGSDGDAYAQGGDGGQAIAWGGDCNNCAAGGKATATGGKGADADANGGVDTEANAGSGEIAEATGGRGGDCDTCPEGKGGKGGGAEAQGRDGGVATGNGTNTDGDGGGATAEGGPGGTGATCCDPNKKGGAGGDGGPAKATGGNAGGPGAANGQAKGSGGPGGEGGDGIPPGQGGAGGAGTNVPKGDPGQKGDPCPMAQKDIKQLVDEEIALVKEGQALLEKHAEGACTEGIERLQSAIEVCDAVLILDPDNADACFCLGTARRALEEDLGEAIQNLECAVEGLEGERRAQAVDILEELEERRTAPISVSMGPVLCAEDWNWETGDPINPGPDFAADSVMEVWCRWELHDPGRELTVVKWFQDGELACQHYDQLDAWSEWTGSGLVEEDKYIEIGEHCVEVYIFDEKMTGGCFTVGGASH